MQRSIENKLLIDFSNKSVATNQQHLFHIFIETDFIVDEVDCLNISLNNNYPESFDVFCSRINIYFKVCK